MTLLKGARTGFLFAAMLSGFFAWMGASDTDLIDPVDAGVRYFVGGLLAWSIFLVPIGAVIGAYFSSPKKVIQCPKCKATFGGRPLHCPECDAPLVYPGYTQRGPVLKEVKEVRETVTVREVVKVRCRYCGALYDEVKDKCPSCGGRCAGSEGRSNEAKRDSPDSPESRVIEDDAFQSAQNGSSVP